MSAKGLAFLMQLPTETVACPALGDDVVVRSMSGQDLQDFYALRDEPDESRAARMLAGRCIVVNGEVIGEERLPKLNAHAYTAALRLMPDIIRISNLSDGPPLSPEASAPDAAHEGDASCEKKAP